MELLIDDCRCDTGEAPIRVPEFDAATLSDLSAAREGRRLRLVLPATPTNDRLLGYGRDPEAAFRFNERRRTAALTADGAVLLRGTARLLSASEAGYTVELRDEGADWATQAAQRLLHDLAIPYAAPLTPTTIRASWTDDTPVKFFPIRRDTYPPQSNGEDLLSAAQLLSTDDYHPFLHLATLVEAIFFAAGYTLQSDFFAGDFFRSLYMSGAYATRDAAGAAARMGFRARRLGEVSATADARGRVEADPAALLHTVGNLVETATPNSVDADGEILSELYNNGRCFAVEEGRILFRPTTAVSVGFDYALRYTTDHRIRSRSRLAGFDCLYLGTGGEMHFELPNRYVDRRSAIEPNRTYRAIVFDHAVGDEYRLLCTRDEVGDRDWSRFAARSALVTTPAAEIVADPRLQVLRGGLWSDYGGDWALYDGHIGETGRTTVELRVRTAAEALAPDKPKYFDRICFFGAEEGQWLTLHKECAVEPRFGSSPGFGTMLSFDDVTRHDNLRQIELIEGLAHLFNLRFRTDAERRIVRVEPFDAFYGAKTVDWRDRTCRSEPVELTDTTTELHARRSWCYGAGDGAVRRFERIDGRIFGRWQHTVEGYGTLAGEEVRRNPLFHPTRSEAGALTAAPSALLLLTGDRDDLAAEDETNCTPRIVRYFGLRKLPAGERWEEGADGYPLAAFHAAGEALTLCFEDRDGAAGLHRFYDRQLRCEELAGRIALTLRCSPCELEELLTPETGRFDLRDRFRIAAPFGETCGVLRRIEAIDPDAGTIRCTFDRTDR